MGAGSGLPKHSPLGASGASKWIACSGSVIQSIGCVDEESEYAAEGTAAHTLGEMCLATGDEPWAHIGTELYGDFIVTKEMADAVQSYVDLIEAWHPDRNQGNSFIERKFHRPDIHEFFYGTSDFVYLADHDVSTGEGENVLHVWDYKHGAGIVVEAKDNPQCMYYACGALDDLGLWDSVERVVIHIVQPRGWHADGPHRTWSVSTEDLDAWLGDECIPAMDLALVSRDTTPGAHCRFCPARSNACPSLMEVMEELQELLIMVSESMTAKTKKDQALEAEEGAKELTNAQLGRMIDLNEIGKIVFKAANKTAFTRLSNGKEIPGAKLVKARSNREYKDGAEKAIKKKFGNKCMTKPELMSPAALDGLPGGKDLTARWAFKPEGTLTIAAEGDPRRRVNRDAKSLFKKQKKGK